MSHSIVQMKKRDAPIAIIKISAGRDKLIGSGYMHYHSQLIVFYQFATFSLTLKLLSALHPAEQAAFAASPPMANDALFQYEQCRCCSLPTPQQTALALILSPCAVLQAIGQVQFRTP